MLPGVPRRMLSIAARGSRFRPHTLLDISPEVLSCRKNNRPVVVLESAFLTHGMPSPVNLETLYKMEQQVRDEGAVPATTAVVDGRIKVGLDAPTLHKLVSEKENTVKTSIRDLPYVVAKGLNGGTTVSATLWIANECRFRTVATGGIGGVHRGGENSMDVSADLPAMSEHRSILVCSGVKSILDIPRTLEFLETQGVTVLTLGPTRDFPGFYSRTSGSLSPYNVTSPFEVADIHHKARALKIRRSMLCAVPVPEEYAIPYEEMEAVISQAQKEAERKNVKGKDVTPFILSRLVELTSGCSLKTNAALLVNNAKIGAQIAKEYMETQKVEWENAVMRQESASDGPDSRYWRDRVQRETWTR